MKKLKWKYDDNEYRAVGSNIPYNMIDYIIKQDENRYSLYIFRANIQFVGYFRKLSSAKKTVEMIHNG